MSNSSFKIHEIELSDRSNRNYTPQHRTLSSEKKTYELPDAAGSASITEIFENDGTTRKPTEDQLSPLKYYKNQDEDDCQNSSKLTHDLSSNNQLSEVPPQQPRTIVNSPSAQSTTANQSSTIMPTWQQLTIIVVIVLAVFAIMIVGISLYMINENKQHTANSQTTLIVPARSQICSTITSVRNSPPNYQIEHLDLNCTHSLSSLTIDLIVQRVNNEIHAHQYQTFWNDTTNMTYMTTPSQIIYTWYSLPDAIIKEASFPHFIEAQYFYTSDSVRVTSHDKWSVSYKTISGERFTDFGSF